MSDKPQTASGEPILRTQGLTKRFGGLVAVSDVSLDLHVGEVHVVIGPNGAGKSTLTNLLSATCRPLRAASCSTDATLPG